MEGSTFRQTMKNYSFAFVALLIAEWVVTVAILPHPPLLRSTSVGQH